MRTVALLLGIALAAAQLAGCATRSFADVTTYHSLDHKPRKYALLARADQQGPEHRTYADLVRARLNALGWQEVPVERADVAVFLKYKVAAHSPISLHPVLGSVPVGLGHSYAYGSKTTENVSTGVAAPLVTARTVYDRELKIDMFPGPSYRADPKPPPLLALTATSVGSIGSLPAIMPVLVRAAFDDFPGDSGKSRWVIVSY